MYNARLNTSLIVTKTRGFSKAAEKLYITPPAVVKQINALERHLPLFRRTHRRLDLFNQCQENDTVIIAFQQWRNVHPLAKISAQS